MPAEDWNAQISLMTGMAAAEMMLQGRVGILRTMPEPEGRTVAQFRRQARALGVTWPEGSRYGEFLRSLDRSDPQHLALIHEATVLFRGAGYTPFDGELPEQTGHAAVAAAYAHVTAPLRRLVDRFGLVVCEALCRGVEVPAWARESLPSLPEVMARSDRVAAAVDRASTDAVEVASLQHLVGQTFRAVVVDARKDGGLIQIAEPAILAPLTGAGAGRQRGDGTAGRGRPRPAGAALRARVRRRARGARPSAAQHRGADPADRRRRRRGPTRTTAALEDEHECHRRSPDQRPGLRRPVRPRRPADAARAARGGRRVHGRAAGPAGLLGLREGDAHVIRNAGGVVTEDAIRSLAISQRLLGTREIVLIHHTDCGMLTFTDDDFKAQVEADTGLRPPWSPESFRDPAAGRAPVPRPHPGEPVHPAQGPGARLRLLGHRRHPDRGVLSGLRRLAVCCAADESVRRSRRCCGPGVPGNAHRRGTSGLRRAGWWLTATRGDPRDSATENRPPRRTTRLRPGRRRGKGETVV